ncbi:MAG: photosystem reaction center subunit [Clostridiaceae bacterium]|jgi:uncharacterized protein YrrD|nr:photosystem reaction center subunit [Clostridiaceae bacterium]
MKDFILMEVFNVNGRKIGYIKDILMDFNKKKVMGFKVSSSGIFSNSINVLAEDIISFNNVMIVSRFNKNKYFSFSEIKGLDTVDTCGNIIGMIEECIFSENDLSITGLLISTGFFNNFINGKLVIPICNTILGDDNLLNYKQCGKFNLRSMPHKLFKEDGETKIVEEQETN